MKVRCPRCKQETEYSSENIYRPFCSERCQMIDLGQWANEDFRIPVSPSHSEEEEEVPDSTDENSGDGNQTNLH